MTDEYTSSSADEAEHEAQPVFAPYDAPAGGWGALHAVAKALREQSIVLKGSRSLLSMNQPDGFDCPGCAWPDPRHTSSFEFCENGAKAVAFELTKRRVTREFFARYTVRELEQQSDYWLEEQGRLTEPMRYDPATDHYVPIEWEDAFACHEPTSVGLPESIGIGKGTVVLGDFAHAEAIFIFGQNPGYMNAASLEVRPDV
jgi:anaerobic selenocysteine-containing dehydrogenase